MNNFCKYPKTQANQEIVSKRFLIDCNPQCIKTKDNEDVTDDVQNYIKNKISTTSFSCTGASPYIFDFIAYMCTHFPGDDYIHRKNDTNETHYRINRIPSDFFLDYTLGKEGSPYKDDLLKEIKKITEKNTNNPVYDDKKKTITYTPIISITIEAQLEDTHRRFIGFKNINNPTVKKMTYISIDFYKPLWEDLFLGKHGRAWFALPSKFHVKMKNAITKIQRAKEDPLIYPEIHKNFNLLGISNSPISYRKFFFYLNKHDNGQGKKLIINAIDMAIHCQPCLLRMRNNKLELCSWWNTRDFIIKGLSLLHYMGINKCMTGAKLVPEGVFYEKGSDTVSIRVNRNTENINEIFKVSTSNI